MYSVVSLPSSDTPVMPKDYVQERLDWEARSGKNAFLVDIRVGEIEDAEAETEERTQLAHELHTADVVCCFEKKIEIKAAESDFVTYCSAGTNLPDAA